ncbi:hypothetical protein MMC22_011709 [Lobaria immixta]|nr:hypothetical protein [Lobaria immixta]
MTVVSWYGMLRNGVQLIHDEIKEGKSYKRDVKEMVDDLGRHNKKLEQWREQWMIWKETPDSLHRQLWGETEYSTITIKLKSMMALSMEGRKELSQYVKLPTTNWGAMEKAKRKFLKKMFIWTKRKYLQALLEKMAKTLKEVDDAAKDGWQRDWPHKEDGVDFALVHSVSIGHLIVPIAMQTHRYTETLWQYCDFARESHTTELDLDIFGASLVDSKDKYSKAITKAAAEQHAILTILTRDAALQTAEMTRVCIERTAASTENSVTALADALSRVINGSEECHFKASEDLAFNVFKSRREHYGPGTGMRQTFREIQSRNPPPSFTNGALLGSISKFRIAYELAQACLLFLRTKWFSEICSCGIHCGRPSDVCDELQYDFTLRLGKVEHQPAKWADTQIHGCWGQRQHSWNVLTKPLRRLGLLLIEVTLGATVLETQCDASGAISSITFVEGKHDDLRRKIHQLDTVMENVRLAAHKSLPYKKAVSHCATANFPQTLDDTEMKELLAKFYWNVVVPIKDLYDKLLDQHLKRKRYIDAARGL